MTVKELKAILGKIDENKKVYIGKVENKIEFYNGQLGAVIEQNKDVLLFSVFDKA